MSALSLDDATPATRQLLDDLERLTGRTCHGCPRAVCGHEVLFSVALGCKDAPRCLGCLARGLGQTPVELRDQLAEHFHGRECYRVAWQAACQREGTGHTYQPACLATASDQPSAPPAAPASDTTLEPAARWDAGELACGELVLALRRRLNGMSPGSVLEVTALDPAAPEDLPAWCRLTGHRLRLAAHPRYLIQRRES